MQTPPLIYCRDTVRLHRDRAARMIASGQSDDFLYVEIAQRLADCLADMKRDFPRVLELGCRSGHIWPLIKHKAGSELYLQTDFSDEMVKLAAANDIPSRQMDEEALDVDDEKFDLVIASGLHWVNDLPGALIQIRNALKPDGLFLGVCISGQTLVEAQSAMMEAEQQTMGGVSLRFSPGFDLRDGAALLQRADFALPVADLNSIKVTHSSAMKLIKDLRMLGETNAHAQRLKRFSSRNLIPAFATGLQGDAAQITTKFDLMFFSGWSPHASQQQPLARGSAEMSFTDIFS